MDSCLGAACIIDFLNTYPFIITLISLPITFYGGWYLYKKRIDHDAINVHFKDLKDQVIIPLLTGLKLDKDLVNLDDQTAYKSMESLDPNFSIILFGDFLENHYPEIKQIWMSSIEYIIIQRKLIENKIGQIIRNGLDLRHIPYEGNFLNMKETQKVGSVIIPLVRNAWIDNERLIMIYTSDMLGEPEHHPPYIKYGFGGYTEARICYIGSTDEETFDINNQLFHIFENEEKTIKSEIEDFRRILSSKSKHFIQLQDSLEIISNKTALKIERKNFEVKCKFVKPAL